jgi:hypothetical protein
VHSSVLTSASLEEPSAQFLQSELEVSPCNGENRPAPHPVHSVELVVSAYFPGSQARHSEAAADPI